MLTEDGFVEVLGIQADSQGAVFLRHNDHGADPWCRLFYLSQDVFLHKSIKGFL